MGRPIKEGLEYFPQDSDIHSDRKIRRLRKEFCANGYLVYDYIKCLIYKEGGYWLKLDDELVFDVADYLDCGITVDFVNKVIKYCFDVNLFHKGKFEDKGILTSSGIQKRFLKAKRGGKISAEFIVIAAETPVIAAETSNNENKNSKSGPKLNGVGNKKHIDNIVIAAETPVIAAETPVIAAETPVIAAETPVIAKKDTDSTQSKVKEIKGNNNNNNKEENQLNFEESAKFYKNNWHLSTTPEICMHFFFIDRSFDLVRADCLRILALYIDEKEEILLDHLKCWAIEFNGYLHRTEPEKTMKGSQGYQNHFYNWLRNMGSDVEKVPKTLKKEHSPTGPPTARQILKGRGL